MHDQTNHCNKEYRTFHRVHNMNSKYLWKKYRSHAETAGKTLIQNLRAVMLNWNNPT